MSKCWSRRAILKSAGVLVLLPLHTRTVQAKTLDLRGTTMGTYYRVRIEKWPDDLYLPALKRAIERVLRRTEDLMSTYRADSEISRFNNSATKAWQKVSAPTARVVATGLAVQHRSAGAFNPAAAPLVEYWGFGVHPKPVAADAARAPAALLKRVHAAGIETKPGFVRKANTGAALDLNGIAKGDALDRVAAVLEHNGIPNYLIEVGGEVRVAGNGPGGQGWRIGIDHPAAADCVLRLNSGAVATSGDYVNYYVRDGRRICHILDPRQGRPVKHALSMVSVVANTAMQADAWATALFVMGPRAGWKHATTRRMAAMFLLRDGTRFSTYMTPAFKRLRRS